MLKLTSDTRIYVASKAIDCRKAINGLCCLVLDYFAMPPNDGSVYVFYNRACDRIKCLYWDKNGFVLYHKRLERGHFKLKTPRDALLTISQEQLSWLLAGLDFCLMQEFSHLNYSGYF
jgi:transposase